MKNEKVLMFAKMYREQTGFPCVIRFSRDNKIINEIELSVPVNEELFNKFFKWWRESWYFPKGILPNILLFNKEIDRIIAYKPNEIKQEDYR